MDLDEEFWRLHSLVFAATQSGDADRLDSLADLLKHEVESAADRQLPAGTYRLLYGVALMGHLMPTSLDWQSIMGMVPVCAERPEGRVWLLGTLATEAAREYERRRGNEFLTAAESVFRLALADTEEGTEEHAKTLFSLAMLFTSNSQFTGSADAARRAAEFARLALPSAPEGSQLQQHVLMQLGKALLAQASFTGHGHEYADEGIAVTMTLLGLLSGDSGDAVFRSEVVDFLLGALVARAQTPVPVSAAWTRAYRALSATYPDEGAKEAAVRNLAGGLLADSARMTRDPAALDAAIDGLTMVCGRSSPADPLLLLASNALTRALLQRSEQTGSSADIDSAVRVAREALERTENADTVIDLANALTRLGERSATARPLSEAVHLLERLLPVLAEEDADRADVLNSLCITLKSRAELTGLPDDVTAAIGYGQQAAELASRDTRERAKLAVCLLNLGTAHRFRYSLTADVADLQQAIDRLRTSVEVTPANDPGLAMRLSNLGYALKNRYELFGASSDLDEAIEITQQAAEHAAPGSIDHARFLGNLCADLVERSGLNNDERDLRQARETGRAAVDATPPGHPLRGLHLVNLCGALLGNLEKKADAARLGEALGFARKAVAETVEDSPYRAPCLAELASILYRRYQLSGNSAELEEAITSARGAADAVPAQSPGYARYAGLLAHLLTESGHADALREAAALATRIANSESAGTAARVNAAKMWAIALDQAGAPADEVYRAYRHGVELLPQLAWRGIETRDQESMIAEQTGLASQAAERALEAGRAEDAVEVLEMGRGVFWSQILDLRSDLKELRTQYPERARRLEDLRAVIDSGNYSAANDQDSQ